MCYSPKRIGRQGYQNGGRIGEGNFLSVYTEGDVSVVVLDELDTGFDATKTDVVSASAVGFNGGGRIAYHLTDEFFGPTLVACCNPVFGCVDCYFFSAGDRFADHLRDDFQRYFFVLSHSVAPFLGTQQSYLYLSDLVDGTIQSTGRYKAWPVKAKDTMAQNSLAQDGAYADDTVMVDALGGGAKIRILAVLISESDRDLNATAICDQAGIGTSAFYNHIEDLLRWELVKKTRMAGNSPMYQINKESEAAEKLANFEWSLIEFLADKEDAGEVNEDNRPILVEK